MIAVPSARPLRGSSSRLPPIFYWPSWASGAFIVDSARAAGHATVEQECLATWLEHVYHSP